jgi:23S rRNA (cytosine1962-C5)-methyltransferase
MHIRDVVWPHFRAEDVLWEDDDLVFVHKPAGVPSQAADEVERDDLVLRLRTFLSARDGRDDVYLGVHQRLDRETSGVVVFTKRPSANPSIAKQFETRFVKKRYLAAVVGWPRERRTATLDDRLGKGESGRMEVVRRGGQKATTHVVVKARRGDRVLLELALETGRTHQARVQLAHARAPIAGDVLYGGPEAPRLLLHASSIEIAHPTSGKRLVVRDEDVSAIDAWLEKGPLGAGVYDDRKALDRALALATERRWGLGRSSETTAFRLVNEEGDALPGLAVDVYGDHLVAQLYAGGIWEDAGRRERVLDRLHALGFAGVYLKSRPKQANVLVDTRREELAPREAVRGSSAEHEIEIRENGVPFLVRLGDGLSTGIFLDQRRNRRLVLASARAKSVANLFAYTCAFSIVAAAGAASRTVSVDASVAALERGRAGFEHARIAVGQEHAFVAEDAFAWLARMAKKKERFDLVILDPPSYSSTKKRRFVAESDYDDLVALAAVVVAPGGQILACCNHRGVLRAKLRRLIHEGARAANREVTQLKDLHGGADYPPMPGHEPHLKSFLVTLR